MRPWRSSSRGAPVEVAGADCPSGLPSWAPGPGRFGRRRQGARSPCFSKGWVPVLALARSRSWQFPAQLCPRPNRQMALTIWCSNRLQAPRHRRLWDAFASGVGQGLHAIFAQGCASGAWRLKPGIKSPVGPGKPEAVVGAPSQPAHAIGIGVVCTSPGSGGEEIGGKGSGGGTFGLVAMLISQGWGSISSA